jgi:hypothetical protein
MKRAVTGHYATTTVAGEAVRAFVPDPLPPTPALDLDHSLSDRLSARVAVLAMSA